MDNMDKDSHKKNLLQKAAQIRRDIADIVYRSSAGHIGGSLSETDILVALYYKVMKIDPQNPQWPDRDRFILSKGHAIDAYYCVLADSGFFNKEDLKTYSQFGSDFIGHPNRAIPGIEMNTGALGHGLSIGVGMAMAAKMDKKDYRVFVLMGDGEQAEGSVWEAAMAAANYKLDNLVAIIDRNCLQISGRTKDVMALTPLKDKWKSFGWNVSVVDGHDIPSICSALSKENKVDSMPSLVIAETIKGKGISFMENNASWHHGVMSEDEYKIACEELDKMLEVFL
ncbi:MAG TPA: transketolase [Thermoclostridium sp.]|nr:transketolase [Thermoclostridium sp.]